MIPPLSAINRKDKLLPEYFFPGKSYDLFRYIILLVNKISQKNYIYIKPFMA